MLKMAETALGAAYEIYRRQEAFFPLVAAVLLGAQEGSVHADDAIAPHRLYVEHSFGFAQAFGRADAAFDETLRRYLITDKAFPAGKVRLYTPDEPEFLRASEYDGIRAVRRRYELDTESAAFAEGHRALSVTPVGIRSVSRDELPAIEARFGVVRRFWRCDEDFLSFARAVVAWVDGQPAAICYAAAVADGRAEVDVLTAAERRRAGLGRLVVQAFNEKCLREGLRPVWDCFTNNAGSVALCGASGFYPARPPYPFYTINK